MEQYNRMINGLECEPCDDEIIKKQRYLHDKLWEFNQLKPSDKDAKEAYMKEVFAECGENNYIELPFHASLGGSHVHFGSDIYVNYNMTLFDDGHIYIGSHCLIGPNVIIAPINHPLESELKKDDRTECSRNVYIGENVWIGAGVIILPGVHIGKNSVIGAGSVVTCDIPENVVAVGNPCHVLREIGEQDREFFQ